MNQPPIQRLGTAALDKALQLLAAILADGGRTPVAELSTRLGLPGSTARRMLGALERQGLVARVDPGRYAAGGQMILGPAAVSLAGLLTSVARRPLHQLATTYRATAHLGVFEDGMVTYLVKESPGATALFTREMGQLEAYCTGVGKMLLADLSPDHLDIFLGGSFVALTPQTITDPDQLRAEIARIRHRGYAIDDREMDDNVFCVAVPLSDRDGRTVAALSLSGTPDGLGRRATAELHAVLHDCARKIAKRAGIRP